MLEAFAVGVRLKLLDGVSTGLGLMSRKFAMAGVEADALQKKINLIKTSMFVGGGMLAASGSIFWLIDKTLPAANAYARQLNIMNMAGMKHAEIASAIGAAWKNTHDVVTSTATGNLSTLMDLRNVLTGGMSEAIRMLPIVSKISAVMAASSESSISANSQHIGFDIAKAMDIMGYNTFAQMQHGAEQMSKVVTAFQNRVSPTALAQTLYYARQAKYSPDDAFTYGVLPTMMLERAGSGGGGGSRGIGPQLAALNRVAVMGTMNKNTIAWFQGLGLLHGRVLPTSTIYSQTAGLDNRADWQNNMFFATWAHLVPALMRHGVANNPTALRNAVETSHMQQTAMSSLLEFVTKPGNYLRDMSNIGVMPALKDLPPLLRQMAEQMHLRSGQGAIGYEQAYKMAMANDPVMRMQGLKAQWENILTQIGFAITPALLTGMTKLVGYLGDLSGWMQNNPQKVKFFMESLLGLGAALGTLGSLTIVVGGLKSLGWILGGSFRGALYMVGVDANKAATGLLRFLGPLGLIAGIGAAGIYSRNQLQNDLKKRGQQWHWWYDIPGGELFMPSKGGHGTVVHVTNIHLDGKQIASVVSQHQGNEIAKPSTGPSGFDTHMSPLWPDFATP